MNLLAAQDGSVPETPPNLAEPWWNLPQNLLAARDWSAPENQRESLKAILPTFTMVEDTKPIACGEKQFLKQETNA